MLVGSRVRRVAIVGGSRIPFARAHGAYARVGNQEMLTASFKALVDRFGLRGELFPRVADAYATWRAGGSPAGLSAAVTAGAAHWQDVCARVLAAFQRHPGGGEAAVEAMAADPAMRL